MANKLDEAIVVDVESTCWEDKTPERLKKSEIIEIGVAVIDLKTLTVARSESILILPKLSTVSEFCTKLTTLTQEMLEKNGISFHKACSKLRNQYNTNNRLWMSWGDYDRRQFERQCKQSGAQYPFGPTHLNVKNLYAIITGLSREVGMDQALIALSMSLEGTHHRGVDDARNIAKIACRLLDRSK